MIHLNYLSIAPMNIHFLQYPLAYFLDCVTAHGLEKIELWGGAPHLYVDTASNEDIQKISCDIISKGLKVACFTPETCVYPINIASSDVDTRRRSLEYEIKSVGIARDLGSSLMQVVSGKGCFDKPIDDAWKWSCDSLHRIAEVAQRSDINLTLEPLSPYESNLVIDISSTERMLAQVNSPILGINLDTVPLDMMQIDVSDCFKTFGKKINHFHLCDRDNENSWIPCGDGIIPISEILKKINNHQYQGALGLEICGAAYYPDPNEALKRSLSTLKIGLDFLES